MLFICIGAIVSLYIIIKSGFYMVKSALAVHRASGLSEVFIGATLLSACTTLPRLLAAGLPIQSYVLLPPCGALRGVIFTASVIAAAVIFVCPQHVPIREVRFRTIFFYFCSAIFWLFLASGGISRTAGLILIGVFLYYAWLLSHEARELMHPPDKTPDKAWHKTGGICGEYLTLAIYTAIMAIGAAAAAYFTDEIAGSLYARVPVVEKLVLPAVYSLPEISIAIAAICARKTQLSLGNILGSSILSIILVCGMHGALLGVAENSGVAAAYMPAVFILMGILCFPMFFNGKTSRWQSVALLTAYIAYIFLK